MSYSRNTLRQTERESIRTFLEAQNGLLTGRVLDYGCGEQPYRDLVTGTYLPWDRGMEMPDGLFDAILCTQVLEYLPDPQESMNLFWSLLRHGGNLIITYPTLWEEVESNDLWRFTAAGLRHLATVAGFDVRVNEPRHVIKHDDFELVVGYGAVCRK